MVPKRVEDSTGELVKESPQDLDITEVQVPRLVQLPGTADRPALSHGKVDVEFNFRLASVQPQHATAVPPDVNNSVTGSTTLHRWLSKQTDVPAKASSLKTQPLLVVKLLI